MHENQFVCHFDFSGVENHIFLEVGDEQLLSKLLLPLPLDPHEASGVVGGHFDVFTINFKINKGADDGPTGVFLLGDLLDEDDEAIGLLAVDLQTLVLHVEVDEGDHSGQICPSVHLDGH